MAHEGFTVAIDKFTVAEREVYSGTERGVSDIGR